MTSTNRKPAFLFVILTLLSLFMAEGACAAEAEKFKVLLFTKTAGYRHPSIKQGVEAVKKLGGENQFGVMHTEDSKVFTDENLPRYSVVIFLNTSGDILGPEEKAAFTRFIQAGGGFVGVHAATDTEHSWPWFQAFIGAQFVGHPPVQQATLRCQDHTHALNRDLPADWVRTDEWYNFKNINAAIRPLYHLDESTYKGGTNGANHPAAWYQNYDGGRMFYTCGGHTEASYSEPLFLKHILSGIQYAAGPSVPDHVNAKPADEYFDVVPLATGLTDPMEIAVANDGRVFIAERMGAVKLYSPATNKTTKVGQIDTMYRNRPGNKDGDYAAECGLIGIALDPAFDRNGWIYAHYAAVAESKTRLARFTFKDGNLDLTSEKILLDYPTDRDRTTCHEGGSLAFGPRGELFVSIGDNTCPFASGGYTPTDERPDRREYDAQRSAGNSNDLRGGVLRIVPQADGTYKIPEGNLFKAGTPKTRPEIYTKGCRNPFRISVDPVTGNLFWGEVGPDAGGASNRGPAGHDEVNMATSAGYFGWPYIIGDNKPYAQHDFASGKTGAVNDPNNLSNRSPYNSGIEQLPPAKKALIWYPSGGSKEFPAMGSGGRSAMAGPLCRWDASRGNGMPKYFDGKLIVFEWMRNYLKLVTLDEKGEARAIEPFLSTQRFAHPIDLESGADGSLYLLEYGSKWLGNNDGTLKIIRYLGTNRKPVAKFTASAIDGALPLAVKFDSSETKDKDAGDSLSYEWSFTDGSVQSRQPNPAFTFEKAGSFEVRLKVTDTMGQTSTTTTTIIAGNTRPKVALKLASDPNLLNWGDEVRYMVEASDAEDGTVADGRINPDSVVVTARFESSGDVVASATTQGLDSAHRGTALIAGSTCMACHQVDAQSVGPAFRQIALKYQNDAGARERLANKVIQGGTGVWGHTPMPGQAQHTLDQTREMVAAILKSNQSSANEVQGKGGVLRLPPQPANKEQATGHFVIQATYLDRGAAGSLPLSGESAGVTVKPRFIPQIADDGTLSYLDVEIRGSGPRVAPDTGAGIGYYSNPKATLHWMAGFPTPGEYEVYLTQAVIAPHHGSTYEILVADQKVGGTIVATPGWANYVEVKAGTLKVARAGIHEVVFSPVAMKGTIISNVQSIRFKRIGAK